MWHLIFNLLLVMLGALIDVTTMALMQISKQADERMENSQRRNDK